MVGKFDEFDESVKIKLINAISASIFILIYCTSIV